jgi:hypothetical protein
MEINDKIFSFNEKRTELQMKTIADEWMKALLLSLD